MADINYDVDALKSNIKSAKKNIQTFKDAIQREKDTIKQYREYIRVLEKKKKINKGLTIDARKTNIATKSKNK